MDSSPARDARGVDAQELIARLERLPFSRWHLRARVIVGSATFFDAFDALSLAFVLPVLVRLWRITPAEIGWLIANELSKARGRGRFFLLYELIFPIGLMMTGQIGALLVPSLGWQVMFLIGGLPGLLVTVLLLRLPESPRWLIAKGRLADADAVIRTIEATVPGFGIRDLSDAHAGDRHGCRYVLAAARVRGGPRLCRLSGCGQRYRGGVPDVCGRRRRRRRGSRRHARDP